MLARLSCHGDTGAGSDRRTVLQMLEEIPAALTQVATAGAVTLMTAMATDVWREARERMVGLLGKDDGGRTEVQRLLDDARCRVRAAEPGRRAVVSGRERLRWEASLRQALLATRAWRWSWRCCSTSCRRGFRHPAAGVPPPGRSRSPNRILIRARGRRRSGDDGRG
jgi:hypothetical protein